jgi:hypothetical protein
MNEWLIVCVYVCVIVAGCESGLGCRRCNLRGCYFFVRGDGRTSCGPSVLSQGDTPVLIIRPEASCPAVGLLDVDLSSQPIDAGWENNLLPQATTPPSPALNSSLGPFAIAGILLGGDSLKIKNYIILTNLFFGMYD